MYQEYESPEDFKYRMGRFRHPGSKSALHPGKRTEPCPQCKRPHSLTRRDVKKGYRCDRCAEGRPR